MSDPAITGPLEALLLMATEPVGAGELAVALDVPVPVVHQALEELAAFYDETRRGFELREVGGGWRYYTRAEHHEVISAWVLSDQQARLSQAALETLAVVAYLQPITRARVAAIRGVSVDGVMRTLTTRGLIEEAGHTEETGATLFRTTDHFLERMGYASTDDLPPIAPYLPEASLLEAELAGLADLPATSPVAPAEDPGENGPMTENREIPTEEQVDAWTEASRAEDPTTDQPEPAAADIPAADELDRLSEPS